MKSYYLYKKFMNVLKEGSVEVIITNIVGKDSGYTIGDRIYINHRCGDILNTFVHELIHFLYPELPHRKVYKLEREYIKNSSWFQKTTLLKFLIDRN